ncbi:phage DNA packaging protein J [Bifidobacterium dentium]|nr:phage DNA packaging protein J [Bifidobacterium dentium]MBF9708099.1 phage DNA packaging protein J [Bifidobacterium dentium]
MQRTDQREPVQQAHRVRRVRTDRRTAHVRHDGRHRSGMEPGDPQPCRGTAHLAVHRRVPPVLRQSVLGRPVQGHLQAVTQVWSRRDRHHAEHR